MKRWYDVIRICGIGILTVAMLCLMGCQQAEDAGETMGEALEDAGDATMDAAEDAGDKIEEATD